MWCLVFLACFEGRHRIGGLASSAAVGTCRGFFPSLPFREIEPDQAARRKKKL